MTLSKIMMQFGSAVEHTQYKIVNSKAAINSYNWDVQGHR